MNQPETTRLTYERSTAAAAVMSFVALVLTGGTNGDGVATLLSFGVLLSTSWAALLAREEWQRHRGTTPLRPTPPARPARHVRSTRRAR